MTSLVQFHPSYALSPRDKMRLAKMGLIEDEVREGEVKKELRRAAKRNGNGSGSPSPSGSANSSPVVVAAQMMMNGQSGAMGPPNLPLPIPPYPQSSPSTSSSRQPPASILRKPSYASSYTSSPLNRNVPLPAPTPAAPSPAPGSYTHMPARLLRRKSSRVRFTEELEAGPSGTSMPSDFMPPLSTMPARSTPGAAPQYGTLHRGSSTSSNASARSDPFALEAVLGMGMGMSTVTGMQMGIGGSRSPRSSVASSDDGAFNPQPLRYPKMSKDLARLSSSSFGSASSAWQPLAVSAKKSSIASSIASSPLPSLRVESGYAHELQHQQQQAVHRPSNSSARSWAPSVVSLAPSDSVSYKRDASISSLLSNYYDPRPSMSGSQNGRPSVSLSSLPSSVAPALRHSVSASHISLTSLPSSVAPTRHTDTIPYMPKASISSSLISSGSEQQHLSVAMHDQRKPSAVSAYSTSSSSNNIPSLRNLTSNRAAYASLLPTPHLRTVASLPSINRSGWLNTELGLSPRSTPRELQDDSIGSPLPVPTCADPISPSIRSSSSSFSATNVDDVIARAYAPAPDNASEVSVALSLTRTDTNSSATDQESIDCAIARAHLRVETDDEARSSLSSAASGPSVIALRPVPVREESIDDLIGRAHLDGIKQQYQYTSSPYTSSPKVQSPLPSPYLQHKMQHSPALRQFFNDNDSPRTASPVGEIPLFPVPPERSRPGLNISLGRDESPTPTFASSRITKVPVSSPTQVRSNNNNGYMQTTPKPASVVSWVIDEATPIAPVTAVIPPSLQLPASPASVTSALTPSPRASTASLTCSPLSVSSRLELEPEAHEGQAPVEAVGRPMLGSALQLTAPSLPKLSIPPTSPDPVLRSSPASSVPSASVSEIAVTPVSPVLSVAAPPTPVSARCVPLPGTPDSTSTPRRLPKSPLRSAAGGSGKTLGAGTDESDLDLSEPLIKVALGANIISNSTRLHKGVSGGGRTTLGLGPMPTPSRTDGQGWSGSESEEDDFTMAVRAINDRKRAASSTTSAPAPDALPATPSTPTQKTRSTRSEKDRTSHESTASSASSASSAAQGPITPETGAILPSNVRLSISAAPGAYAWAASGPPSPAGSARSFSSGGSRRPSTLVRAASTASASASVAAANAAAQASAQTGRVNHCAPGEILSPVRTTAPATPTPSALPRPTASGLPRPVARVPSASALPRPTGTLRTPSSSALPRPVGNSTGPSATTSSLPRPVGSSLPRPTNVAPLTPSPVRTTSIPRPKFSPASTAPSASALPRPKFTSSASATATPTASTTGTGGKTARPLPTRNIDDWGAPEVLVDDDMSAWPSTTTTTQQRRALVRSLQASQTQNQPQSLKGRISGGVVNTGMDSAMSSPSMYGSSPATPKSRAVSGASGRGGSVSPVQLHVEYLNKSGSLNSPKRVRPMGNYI